jgi:hypothetical protein
MVIILRSFTNSAGPEISIVGRRSANPVAGPGGLPGDQD